LVAQPRNRSSAQPISHHFSRMTVVRWGIGSASGRLREGARTSAGRRPAEVAVLPFRQGAMRRMPPQVDDLRLWLSCLAGRAQCGVCPRRSMTCGYGCPALQAGRNAAYAPAGRRPAAMAVLPCRQGAMRRMPPQVADLRLWLSCLSGRAQCGVCLRRSQTCGYGCPAFQAGRNAAYAPAG
jgi:hypothetical protein